jgi:hypothetical protein
VVRRKIMYNSEYKKYDKLVPHDWLWTTWKPFNRPQTAPGNDYFVTMGDSFTYGFKMKHYQECWVQKLSENTGLGHVNLAWNGASIEATCRFLDRSLNIDSSKLHIVMLPYPWRTESIALWKGERNRRIKDTGLTTNECIDKMKTTVKKYENKRVVFSNTWGLPWEIKDALALFEHKNFMLNKEEWLDRALDGEHGHAGPKTHAVFVKNIQKFIRDK